MIRAEPKWQFEAIGVAAQGVYVDSRRFSADWAIPRLPRGSLAHGRINARTSTLVSAVIFIPCRPSRGLRSHSSLRSTGLDLSALLSRSRKHLKFCRLAEQL
jgi:hypothetical protein